jgi:hypothetical protein
MNIWYINSGIIDYFTGSKSFFITYKDMKLFSIIFSNKSIILIKNKKTIILFTISKLKV